MPIVVQGFGGAGAEVDGSGFGAVRVVARPADYGFYGRFKTCASLAGMAAGIAPASDIYQLRWTASFRFALLHRLSLDGVVGGSTGFTAGLGEIHAIVARAWTADGSGGNAVASSATHPYTLRSSMAYALMPFVRVANAAALGAGTRTVDAQAFGRISLAFGTAANVQICGQTTLYTDEQSNGHPVVLSANEGIAVRATVPATGNWGFCITAEWSETEAY